MQQRQPRLGDILDDYCPRERRLTNHAVVAMIGDEVKQTRCTTCDAEHEFKHARLPRQRRKTEAAVLAAPVFGAPKKVVHEGPAAAAPSGPSPVFEEEQIEVETPPLAAAPAPSADADVDPDVAADEPAPVEEGPVHRQLIRAQLPRLEGQPPSARPAPDFTIRQPAGRQNRFRPRQPRSGGSSSGGQFLGNRSTGNGNGNVARDPRGGGNHQRSSSGGRPPMNARPGKRQGHHGRKRSK